MWVTATVYQFNIVIDDSYPTGHSTSQGYAVSVSVGDMIISASTGHSVSRGYFDYVNTGLPVSIDIPTGESSSRGFPPIIITSGEHGCYRATYMANNRKPNMVLVIGRETATGNLVFGYADDSEGENSCSRDPRLVWYASSIINSFDMADYGAHLLLDKYRLSIPKGQMTISPNLGQELWDVIQTADTVLNVDTTFRIRGWTLRYDRDEGVFVQVLKLTNV